MGYSITKADLERTSVLEATAYAVKLTVASDNEALYPPKVFVFQDPVSDSTGPKFQCVASLVQLEDLPEDASDPPEDGVVRPYFRLAEFTLISRSPVSLLNMIERIELDIARLEADLNALQALES